MMNERIRELAEQAGWMMGDEVEGFNTRLEKFVQLIVRQCGYYADIFESLGCPGDMDPTETKPSDFIKRQFGVEE